MDTDSWKFKIIEGGFDILTSQMCIYFCNVVLFFQPLLSKQIHFLISPKLKVKFKLHQYNLITYKESREYESIED